MPCSRFAHDGETIAVNSKAPRCGAFSWLAGKALEILAYSCNSLIKELGPGIWVVGHRRGQGGGQLNSLLSG